MRRRLGARIGLHLCPLRRVRLFLIKNGRDVRDRARRRYKLRALGDCLGYATHQQQPSTKDTQHTPAGNARVVHARSSRTRKAFRNNRLARLAEITKQSLKGGLRVHRGSAPSRLARQAFAPPLRGGEIRTIAAGANSFCKVRGKRDVVAQGLNAAARKQAGAPARRSDGVAGAGFALYRCASGHQHRDREVRQQRRAQCRQQSSTAR